MLTYYLPVDEIAGKKLELTADQRGKPLQSLSIKAPLEATCGGAVCSGDAYCVSSKCIKRGGGGGRGILGWILFGLIVGAIAKLVMPGKDPGGIIVTMLLGIVGAVIGGYLGRALGIAGPGEPVGWIMAIIGAILVLAIYRVVAKRA